jgi:hypothetical protein
LQIKANDIWDWRSYKDFSIKYGFIFDIHLIRRDFELVFSFEEFCFYKFIMNTCACPETKKLDYDRWQAHLTIL